MVLEFAVALSLFVSSPPPDVQTASGVSNLAPSVAARREAAYRLYEGADFVGAAVEFEELWREYQDIKDLLGAASARLALQHHANSLHQLRELQRLHRRSGLDPELNARVEGLVTTITTGVPKVWPIKLEIVTIPGVPIEGLRLRATYIPPFASDARPSLEFAADEMNGHMTLELDQGRWRIDLDDPSGAVTRVDPVSVEIPVGPVYQQVHGDRPQILRLSAHRELAQEDARRFRNTTLGAAGGVGVGLALIGGVALGLGQRRWLDARGTSVEACQPEPLYPIGVCRDALASAGTLRSAGLGMLGAGLGFFVGGATNQARRKGAAQIASSMVGVLATGVGVALVMTWSRKYDELNSVATPWDPAYLESARRSAVGHSLGAGILGVGAGLVTGTVLSVVLDRRHTRLTRRETSVSPQVGSGRVGVVLTGRF